MRFAVNAAFAIGMLLPVLETYRRGFGMWRVEFTTMFEDYLAGALLLAGAWAVRRGRAFGPLLLLVAWTWVTGMMTTSFVDQVEVTMRGVDLHGAGENSPGADGHRPTSPPTRPSCVTSH
jgi:hypothetical protein